MFKNKKAVMFLLTAVMAISAAAFIALPKAKAADSSITILIDGQFFQPPDAQPYISNDRVMVPFRPIAEAIGASATWNEADQKVSVALGGKYVEFVIGSSVMNVVTTDSNGGAVTSTVTLDAPATLVNNNRAFVPIRALTEGLGASVQWVAESSTVIITSNTVRATPTPVFTPTPAVNPVFAATDNFEIISGTRAQFMYDNYNQVVIYYFDSSDPNAVSAMPAIMQAAKTVGAKVWGVDIRTSANVGNVNWVSRYLTQGTQGPALFFLYDINQTTNIIYQTSFTDQNQLNTMFQNWFRNIYSNPTLTPTPTPTPTGTITPTPLPAFSDPFQKIAKYDTLDMWDNGSSFILLFFDSSRSDFNQSKLNTAMNAVYDAGEVVYYFDDATESDYNWFGGDYYSNLYSSGAYDSRYSTRIPNPCLFYVSDGTVMDTETIFSSRATLANSIYNFIENYQYNY